MLSYGSQFDILLPVDHDGSHDLQEVVPCNSADHSLKSRNYCIAELAIDQQNHPARGTHVDMDLSGASNELLAETYTDLVRLQDDLVALQSEADVDEDTDPVVGDISKLITQVKAEVQERGLNEQELRDQARQ